MAKAKRKKQPKCRDLARLFKERRAETHHTITLDGQEVAYTATAGTLILHQEDAKRGLKPKASIFYVAYRRTGEEEGRTGRPIVFSFNGGPGSSSVWMHLGLLGPRRVLLDDEGHAPPPPYRLVDNAYSLLDVADLVFIDPVSTGYSRPVPGEKADQFHHLERDIQWVGEFIRLYTTRFRRWASPKFIIGESYGTTRAAGLSGFLQDKYGIYLNGLMLISAVLNFQTIEFHPGNDLPYMLYLPSYTATAWYHRRLPEALQRRELADLLDEVKSFALREYALALVQGDALPAEERQRIARQLARYTGLSEAYIHRTNLRIRLDRFVKELLRDERRTVGRLDSRYIGIDRDAAGESFEYDPCYADLQGAYTAALNDYVRRELDFKSDLPYEILADLYKTWDYGHKNQYVNVAETLRQAMTRNPALKIFVASGYYDLATPYLATEYTFNHLELDASLRPNITMQNYEAGHMMYVHKPSLARLKAELTAFIRAAVPSEA